MTIIVPVKREVHSLYGFTPEDEYENLIIKDTCVKFSRDGVKKLGYHGGL